VIYSPDRTRLLTLSHDDVAHVWDAATGDLLIEVRHPNMMLAEWRNDGRRIETHATDGTRRLWLVDIEMLLALGGQTRTMSLSNEEYARFFLPTLEPTPTPTTLPSVTPLPSLTPTPTIDPALITPTLTPTPRPTVTPSPTTLPPLPEGDPKTVVEALVSYGVLPDLSGAAAETLASVTVDLSDEDNLIGWEWLEQTYTDFVMGATVTYGPGAAEDGCGFVVRIRDNENFYMISVSRLIGFGNQLSIALDEQNNGEWQPVSEPDRRVQGANLLRDRNQFVLAAAGDTFTFFVNGQFLAEWRDETLTSGQVAVAASTGERSDTTYCAFSDVWVWDLLG
jgi:hypothetical protein